MTNSVDFYKTKFKNLKAKARKREALVQKQKQTGGGTLSKEEQRIITSPAYTDLALKLGLSASGNEARADSDAQGTSTQPPTRRLQQLMDSQGIFNFFLFFSI